MSKIFEIQKYKKTVEEDPAMLKFVSELFQTQEIFGKVIEKEPMTIIFLLSTS